MRYSFTTFREYNFYAIVKRKVYELIWPVALLLVIQILFPKSTFAREHWHFYAFLLIEAFFLFLILTSDNIREIVIDTSKKKIEINYYNIYQGNMEETYPLADIKVSIETTASDEIEQIVFIIKKRSDVVLKKQHFNSADLESLKTLLHTTTSPQYI